MAKDFRESDLQELIASTKEAVFRSIQRHLPERFAHSFDDIVQETYIRAWKRLQKEHTIENLRAYLTVIARNESYRMAAKLAREEEKEQRLKLVKPVTEDSSLPDQAEDLLAQLPAQSRNTVSLYLQGRPQKEIADIESIQLGTVKSRIHRAKNILRELVKKGDTNEEL